MRRVGGGGHGELHLTVTNFFGKGRLWTAFSATVPGGWAKLEACASVTIHFDPSWNEPNQSPSKAGDPSSNAEARVVFKIAVPADGCLDVNESEADLDAAIMAEADIYAGHGRSLQGSVLPLWGGLFRAQGPSGSVWVAVLEDVGEALPTRSPDGHAIRPYELRYAQEVLKKFNALHAAGIAHGDVEARHVRVGNGLAARLGADTSLLPWGTDMGLRLIDLDRASTDPARIDLEREHIRAWLGVVHS